MDLRERLKKVCAHEKVRGVDVPMEVMQENEVQKKVRTEILQVENADALYRAVVSDAHIPALSAEVRRSIAGRVSRVLGTMVTFSSLAYATLESCILMSTEYVTSRLSVPAFYLGAVASITYVSFKTYALIGDLLLHTVFGTKLLTPTAELERVHRPAAFVSRKNLFDSVFETAQLAKKLEPAPRQAIAESLRTVLRLFDGKTQCICPFGLLVASPSAAHGAARVDYLDDLASLSATEEHHLYAHLSSTERSTSPAAGDWTFFYQNAHLKNVYDERMFKALVIYKTAMKDKRCASALLGDLGGSVASVTLPSAYRSSTHLQGAAPASAAAKKPPQNEERLMDSGILQALDSMMDDRLQQLKTHIGAVVVTCLFSESVDRA